MQKFIDLCITCTPTFDRDRRVSGRVSTLPRSNCLDVAGVLALSVANKHCHHSPLPTHSLISCWCRQTSSGSESLTGHAPLSDFTEADLPACRAMSMLSVGCSVTVICTCSRYSLLLLAYYRPSRYEYWWSTIVHSIKKVEGH